MRLECLGGPRFHGDAFLAAFRLQAEDLFGMGGRIARPNRRGSTADMFAMKVGLCQGDYGGFPMPFFISTKGYGVFLNNPWPHVYFDLGQTRPDQWWVHGPGGEFDLFVIAGPTFAQIVSRFTELVGRIPLPRRWWLGFWTSALAFASAQEVENVALRLRREGYPCDALVIDGPWRGGHGGIVEQYGAQRREALIELLNVPHPVTVSPGSFTGFDRRLPPDAAKLADRKRLLPPAFVRNVVAPAPVRRGGRTTRCRGSRPDTCALKARSPPIATRAPLGRATPPSPRPNATTRSLPRAKTASPRYR